MTRSLKRRRSGPPVTLTLPYVAAERIRARRLRAGSVARFATARTEMRETDCGGDQEHRHHPLNETIFWMIAVPIAIITSPMPMSRCPVDVWNSGCR